MITQILPVTSRSLAYAKELIEAGEVVAFHTETVYGLGADACNDAAVKKIFALKGRPADNPLIAHVHSGYDISGLVETPAWTARLRGKFLPGPLTMVYPSRGVVSPSVSCGLPTLSLRVPSSPTAQAFLRAVDRPIAAPSANRSKHVSPVTAQHVYDDFAGDIPLILDGGASQGGIESTVLDCTGTVPLILRAGLVTREMIAAEVGACEYYHMQAGEKPKSPGMAYKHYAPSCRTAFFAADDAAGSAVTMPRKGGAELPYCSASTPSRSRMQIAVCSIWEIRPKRWRPISMRISARESIWRHCSSGSNPRRGAASWTACATGCCAHSDRIQGSSA